MQNISASRIFAPLNSKYSNMAFTNNVMIVRRKLLAKLVNLWKENKLTNEIDRDRKSVV